MAEVPQTDLSREELERIASQLPADLLTAEVISRGSNYVGQLMVAAANANGELLPVSYEDRMFNRKVGNFINPDERISLGDQLELMHDFWQRLGVTPPTPNDAQMEALARAVDRYPDRRIIPTPLLGAEERVALAEKSRELPVHRFRPSAKGKALWVPGPAANYGKVLRNPDGIETDASDSSVRYGLRYKALNGDPEPLDKASYENQLASSGQAIFDEGQYGPWLYVITDVRVVAERGHDETANELYQKVSPFLIPDVSLIIQLLHQANGSPNPDWDYDIANEAVYKVDEEGQELSLYRVNGTRWEAEEKFIRSGGIDEFKRSDRYGIRATDSALKMAA